MEANMLLLHEYSEQNRKALIYRMMTKAYLIRFYEDGIIGDYTVAHTEDDAEYIAEDYVMKD